MIGRREKAFQIVDSMRSTILQGWEILVNMESGTLFKEDVDQVAVYVKKLIENLGGQAQIHECPNAGNGIVAAFGKPTSKPPVLFIGHFDTLFPKGTVAERPFKIADGKAYGPGVLDMKGGVIVQIYAAKALMEAGFADREIRIVLAGDEESNHSKSDMDRIFEEQAKGCVAAFNFETGDIDDTLVVGRKGTVTYHITVRGVSVHAGREPKNGRSAILEIAHKVIDIQALSDYDSGITYNVGTVTGGTARNAVPDYARISVDVRVKTFEQLEIVEKDIQKIVSRTYVEGTQTHCEKEAGIAPMPQTPGNENLYEFVKKIAEDSGFPIAGSIYSGGGSDSAYSVKAGVPTLDQLGVKGKWNHSDREYALVDSILERTKLTIASVLELDKFSS